MTSASLPSLGYLICRIKKKKHAEINCSTPHPYHLSQRNEAEREEEEEGAKEGE